MLVNVAKLCTVFSISKYFLLNFVKFCKPRICPFFCDFRHFVSK